MITKRSISKPNSIEEFGEIAISKKKRSFSFSCSRPLSSSQTTTRHHPHPKPTKETRLTMMGIEPRHRNTCGVAVREPKKHTHTTPGHPDGTSKPMISSTPASPCETDEPFGEHGAHTGHQQRKPEILRRKGGDPAAPSGTATFARLLVPITSLTLDGSPQNSIPQGVRPPASGAAHFHDLTGGVYKARERIHRGVADPRLLATPPSRSRVAGSDPN